MASRGVLFMTLGAFVLGGVLGASALYDGSELEQGVRSLAGEEARVVIRVENVGSHALDTTVEVRPERGGESVWSDEWVTPADSVRERFLTGRLRGEFLADAEFEWSEPDAGRQSRGTFTAAFASNECAAGETIVVTFRIDSTRGIAFDDDDDVRCR